MSIGLFGIQWQVIESVAQHGTPQSTRSRGRQGTGRVVAVRPARSAFPPPSGALLHESSRARTMPTDRILTCRCDMTLVGY